MSKEIKEVYVYNGYTDLRIQFSGNFYHFPQGKVTTVKEQYFSAPDLYKREHESSPEPDAMLEKTYSPLDFATRLLTSGGQNLIHDGSVWVGVDQPSEQIKQSCNARGRMRKIKQVEEALAERRAALAKGGRPELDTTIVDWMIEYGVHDDLYNPIKQNELTQSLSDALAAVAHQQKQPEPAGARR